MKRSKLFALLLVLACSLAETVVAASKTENFEFDVEAETRVHIRNFAGDIRLVPGALDKVRVRYTTEDDRIEVYKTQGINWVRVRTDFESAQLAENAPVYFEIEVPPTSRLIVNNTAGDIISEGKIGRVGLTTVSGDIRLDDGSGEVALKTVSGNISVTNIREAELTAETISGNISISSSDFSGESYELQSISGDINFLQGQNASYFLEAVTTTGGIVNRLGNVERTDSADEIDTFINQFFRNANSVMSQTTVFGGFNGNFQSSRVKMLTVSGQILLEKE